MLIPTALLLLAATVAGHVDYSEHKVVKAVPQNDEQLRQIRSLLKDDTIILRQSRSAGRPLVVVLNSTESETFLDKMESLNVNTMVIDSNYSRALRRERRAILWSSTDRITEQILTTKYISYTDQMRFLDQTARDFPGKAIIETMAISYEGRPIKLIRMGADGNRTKPILFIDAGIHAREWISHSAAMYFIYQLTANSTAYADLLNRMEIIVAPNINPDGYEFTRSADRMWRKTRSSTPRSWCHGVDANRNFPYKWGGEGVSFDPCSEIYCGSGGSSESETRGLVEFLQRESNRITGYVALHSYGQEILYPWGYAQRTYPTDVNDLIEVGKRMADAIKQNGGQEYHVENSADGLYAAAGAADDYAKSIGIKYAYTMELAPMSDEIGFELPEYAIRSVQRDVLAALLVLAEQVAKEGLSSKQVVLQYHKRRNEGRFG